ncbi:MAG: thiosulfate dehydrogenase [quinone] large subunit [Psychroserpens sp.]|jgi:thiosulfate dehydrogenase [quinone] large subunit
MKSLQKYSITQISILVLLRWLIGVHFLMEGLNKLTSSFWSSKPFLMQSNWVFSDVFIGITEIQWLLNTVDFLNIWGQIIIGLCLVLGLFTKWTAFAGALLLFLYYAAAPPFVYNFSFIDKNIIELFSFLIVAIFPTSQIVGLDLFLNFKKVKNFEKK